MARATATTDSNYRYYVLAMLTLTGMLNVGDRLVFSILMEDIKGEYAMSDTQLALLAGFAFTIFYATLGLPIARLADKYNRKNIIAASLTVWSTMTALCGAATGFVTLFLARMGVGAGEAGGSPPSYSLIADYFKPAERTRAMSIWITGAVFGTAGGLIVGGALADAIGWRWTFVALGVPDVILGLVLYLTVREQQRGRYDGEGQTGVTAQSMSQTWKSLLSNHVYLGVSISYALLTMIGYAIAVWLAAIMIRNFDVSTTRVGLILGLGFLVGGIPGPIIGAFITDKLVRRNAKWRAWLPAIASLLAFGCYCISLSATSFPMFIGSFVLGYFIFMIPQGPSMSLLQDSLKPEERAFGVSCSSFVNNVLGQLLGIFAIGYMSDNLVSAYGTRSLNVSVMILCGVAAVLSFASYMWTASAIERSDHLPDQVASG